MRIEVINTGTELLLGKVINTHAAFFGDELFKLGLRIQRQTTIPDGDDIHRALKEAFPRCDMILVTGGLGPTSDDITRETAAGLLGLALHKDEAIWRITHDARLISTRDLDRFRDRRTDPGNQKTRGALAPRVVSSSLPTELVVPRLAPRPP